MKLVKILVWGGLLSLIASSSLAQPAGATPSGTTQPSGQNSSQSFGHRLGAAALLSAGADITYNGAYVGIDYPWGDVPATQGVCTDVVVRAYAQIGVDLQSRVHADMKQHFDAYPARWGLTRPDRNIDHRRVPNLETFLARNGEQLSKSTSASDYHPGDLVAWMVPKYGGGTTPHIGVVSPHKNARGEPLIVHHLSGRPKLEPVLFTWPMTGHYRYHVRTLDRVVE